MTQNVSDEDRPTNPLVMDLSRQPFGPAEQRVASYLLSVPEHEVALMTAEELARRAGASRSTVARVTAKLGLGGYRKLKSALVRGSRSGPAASWGESQLDPGISAEDGPAVVAQKIASSVAARVYRFAELLTANPDFERVVELVSTARAVGIFGVGSSSVVGLDLYHRLAREGITVHFAEDAHTQLAVASMLRPGDVGWFVSYSGHTGTTVRAAEVARTAGASRVAVTARAASPLADVCEYTIMTPQGVGLFGNDAAMTRILQVMFNEILFHCLILRDPSRLTHLGKVDELLSREKI